MKKIVTPMIILFVRFQIPVLSKENSSLDKEKLQFKWWKTAVWMGKNGIRRRGAFPCAVPCQGKNKTFLLRHDRFSRADAPEKSVEISYSILIKSSH